MAAHWTKVAEGGRLVIPADFRRQLGLEPGTSVLIDVADGELRVRSQAAAIKQVQDFVRSFVPAGVSLVDELIAERRAEAERE